MVERGDTHPLESPTDSIGANSALTAAIKAVETADTELGRIAEAVRRAGGALLATADHGNCEVMRDPGTGEPHTAHTTNPVPALLAGVEDVALADGRLADIAPTLLELMGLPKPPTDGRCFFAPPSWTAVIEQSTATPSRAR